MRDGRYLKLDLGVSSPWRRSESAPFKMWLRMKEKQIEAQTSLAAEKAAQYAAHVERIEARVRVLEQIVTDGGAKPPPRSRRCANSRASRVERKFNEPV